MSLEHDQTLDASATVDSPTSPPARSRAAGAGNGSAEGEPCPAAGAPSGQGPFVPRVDGYEVIGPLGEGGMGVVWRAVQHGTHRDVALKLMSVACFKSERARLRFRREVDLTARLEHPHIARVYDGGESRGVYYYAMELIDGVPLHEHVATHRLNRRQVLDLMRVVCEAVQYAHQKGVIHRDLKPTNVLVTADGQPKVLDFGLAKATADEGTMISQEGDVAGTPAYMSPEQAAGHMDKLDTRSDVYTLGVILFHLLSGQFPHDVHGSSVQVMRRIAEQEPRRLKSIQPGADPELEAILTKALAREPARRYDTAGGLAADLGRYLAGEPLEARPPTLTYLLSKRVRRYRVPLAVAGLVAVTLLGTAVWAYVRVTREKDAALAANVAKEQQRQRADEQRLLAELRRAQGLVKEADALGVAGRWIESKAAYEAAHAALAVLGQSTLAAEAGQSIAYMYAPPPLLTLRGHEHGARDVAVAPDGRVAVSAGRDDALRVWDTRSGQLLHALRGHAERISAVAISPDGRHCLSASHDQTVKLWDLRSRTLVRTMAGYTRGVRCVAFGRGGCVALSGDEDGAIVLWDLESGSAIRTIRAHPGDHVLSVAVSADGARALSGGRDGCIKLWDLTSGENLWTRRRDSGVLRVAFLPDGRTLLSGGDDKDLLISRLADGSDVRSFFGHAGGVRGVAVDPAGRFAVSTSTDRTLRLWDLSEESARLTLTGHDGPVNSVALYPGATRAISASTDGTLKVWDVRRDREVVRLGSGKTSAVVAQTVSPDGRLVATVDEANALKLWDLRSGRLIRDFGVVEGDRFALAFAAAGEHLCVTNRTALVRRDVSTGSVLARVTAPSGRNGESVFTPDGLHVLSGGDDGTSQLWDVDTGDVVATLSGREAVRSLAVSGDGRSVLTGHADGRVRLWDLSAGRVLHEMTGHHGIVWSVAFVPDGCRAVSGGFDQSIRVWDLVHGSQLRNVQGHTAQVQVAAVGPGGTTIVSAGADHTLRLWDLETGKELQTRRYQRGPTSLGLARDGLTVVSGWHELGTEVWDLARPAQYRAWEPRVRDAQVALERDPTDAAALATLGEWYAFRDDPEWAADLLEQSRAHGGRPSSPMLADCYWRANRRVEAAREFERALTESVDEREKFYLRLCLKAVAAEAETPTSSSR